MTLQSHDAFHSPRSRAVGGPVGLWTRAYRQGVKRALDLVLVLMSVPFVLPLVAGLALAVALSGGQPFYRQRRVGRHGRVFHMWKLRTMVPDAEARLEAYLAANPLARIEWDRDQKLRDDPRITRLGAALRRSSLDELPQLWNVLRGDMSLVGPRPMMPDQVPLYPGTAYYTLRPGLTGRWQVSARNASTFAERAVFDTAYAATLSLAEDLRLLRATVTVVLRGTGC